MGMPSRQLLLLGLAGLGGLAVLVDQTLLSKATAGVAEIGAVVEKVKKAQEIASSLDDGGPEALNGLLEALVTDGGITPGQTSPGLFDAFAAMTDQTAPASESPISAALADLGAPSAPGEATPPTPAHRVTMVMTGASGGGIALIDGRPMRAGESRDGITLLEVRNDGVSVREAGATTFLALR